LKLEAIPRGGARTCPYCKDAFAEPPRVCEACAAALHPECFEENAGCTTLGCGLRHDAWPRCPKCRGQLIRRGAIVCVQCGYDLQRHEPIRTQITHTLASLEREHDYRSLQLRRVPKAHRRDQKTPGPSSKNRGRPILLFLGQLPVPLAFLGLLALTDPGQPVADTKSLVWQLILTTPIWAAGSSYLTARLFQADRPWLYALLSLVLGPIGPLVAFLSNSRRPKSR